MVVCTVNKVTHRNNHLQLPVVYEREFTTMEDKKHLEIRSGEYNLN